MQKHQSISFVDETEKASKRRTKISKQINYKKQCSKPSSGGVSFIDETSRTTKKIINKTIKSKTLRLRKTLLNDKLLNNYFVFNSEKQEETMTKYKLLSDHDNLVGIVNYLNPDETQPTTTHPTLLSTPSHSPTQGYFEKPLAQTKEESTMDPTTTESCITANLRATNMLSSILISNNCQRMENPPQHLHINDILLLLFNNHQLLNIQN